MKTTLRHFAALAATSALALAPAISQAGPIGLTYTPVIQAGDPNGTPPDSPALRVDPNVPTSPFSGVVSINIRYPDPAHPSNQLSFICSGTLVSPRHVVTAGHCVDTTGNGTLIDISQPNTDVRVVFNADTVPGSPGRAVVTATQVSMDPFYQGFGNCPAVIPPGNFCVNDDVAVITLGQDAPAGARIYPIVVGAIDSGQLDTMVGYGQSGDGVNGYTVGPDFRVRRVGQNYMDVFDLNDEQGFTAGPREVWYSDFDHPGSLDTDCLLFGVCTPVLPNNVETALGGGDSGGPSFYYNGQNYWLMGNNTFSARISGSQVPGTFGTLSGGILLYSYIPYLEQATNGAITLIPEPQSALLMLSGLAALAMALRRRRR